LLNLGYLEELPVKRGQFLRLKGRFGLALGWEKNWGVRQPEIARRV